MPRPSPLLNLLLPGAGLVLRGRLGWGLGLLLPALVCLTLAALAGLLATADLAARLRWVLLPAWALLAAAATLRHWLADRRRAWDPERARALHREVAIAYLTDDLAGAALAAARLAALAAEEPGTWRLVALVATAQGDARAAADAQARLLRLDQLEAA